MNAPGIHNEYLKIFVLELLHPLLCNYYWIQLSETEDVRGASERVASSPGLFPLFTHRRKEPGNIGGLKQLTSGGSDRAPQRGHLQSDCRMKSRRCVTLSDKISQSKTNKVL